MILLTTQYVLIFQGPSDISEQDTLIDCITAYSSDVVPLILFQFITLIITLMLLHLYQCQ